MKKFQMETKEWLLLILALILGQLILHYISMDFSRSGRALGYISIAGTVVSIMLGFIAIIYSFVQSITHSNSVAEIKTQVEKLIEAGHGISGLERGLQKSAKKIRSATEMLTLHINNNTKVSERVCSEMENLKQAYAKEPPISTTNIVVNSEDSLPPLESRWVLLEVTYLMVYHAALKEISLIDFHANVILGYSAEAEWVDPFITGAFTSTSMHLADQGIVFMDKSDGSVMTLRKGVNFYARLGEVSLDPDNYQSEETLKYLELFGDEIREARAAATQSR